MAVFIVLLALMSACAAKPANPFEAIGSIVGKITNETAKDIAGIKHPIEEGVVYVGTSQCAIVKKLLGDTYTALGGEIEPDLNDLKIVFRNSQVKVEFNISAAAEFIPKTTGFDPTQKLYLFVHGFTSSPEKESFTAISDALFSEGNINVLALDASSLIKWLYLRASTYVTFIGLRLGEVLAEMIKHGVDPEHIHIIGHSLGAHISGFAGKKAYELTGKRVGRISGLDPAGPCFSDVGVDKRLLMTDAAFVDVIHSNAGILGLDYPMGHADYWPNGGSLQANCFYQSCSHGRSWVYYAESVINPEAFPAIKCDSWDAFKKGNCSDEISYMGFASNSSASGNYYLRTADYSSYGLGMNGLIYDDSNEGLIQKIANQLG